LQLFVIPDGLKDIYSMWKIIPVYLDN
jgi:hypothetical protein